MSFQVSKELFSQNFILQPFIRETNTANKTTTHRYDLHQKRSTDTIVKMPPSKQNERNLKEIEIEEMSPSQYNIFDVKMFC